MNKRILIIKVFILSSMSLFAQDFIKLPDSYFLNRVGLDQGKPLTINKVTHYNLYLKSESDSVRNLKNEEKTHFYDLVYKSEVVNLVEGNYYYDNNTSYFKFKINKEGLLSGDALLKDKRNDNEVEMFFVDGVFIKGVTKRFDKMIVKLELKDSIFSADKYDEDGRIESRDLCYLKFGNSIHDSNVFIRYFKNGSVSSERNMIKKTFVAYYENGNLKAESDEIKKIDRSYDQNGKLESNRYAIGNEKCSGKYDSGLIHSRRCESPKEIRDYYYDNKGKLKFYKVFNKDNSKTTEYDPKGKIIKQPYIEPAPSIGW
ncbi:MAG: hypothetical protein REI96_07660 [Flavobacterium nitrogenifigens]|uniref:hypothetical protein n=1 Tax=Flavobacterium nitrogenifigens TaxID=1617283 RepID=UPI0028069927|nr:hypothetical protein [Flavobacterium nitrogenifigens]MDQ8012306.1 hypothetical protein [Flavobacterium nitrogenifigens]